MSCNEEAHVSETAENAQLILQNVMILSDLSSKLKQETKNGENYLNSLSSLLCRAEKDVSSLNQSVDSLITIAKKLVFLSLQIIPSQDPNFKSLQTEADKLLNVLDEMTNHDELDEKWKYLTLKKNQSTTKCLNSDEKYPEHCSRESLLETSNFVALPTVPEDIFTDFHRPSHTLSSGSLKNLRKVKMCLQKVSDLDAETMTEEVILPEKGLKTCETTKCSFKETNTENPLTVSVGTTTS